jgi:hypothetical protein
VGRGLLTVEHDRRALCDFAHIAGLLSQLTNRRFLCRLACVDESRWDLDGDLVDRGAVLFLEDDLRAYCKVLVSRVPGKH